MYKVIQIKSEETYPIRHKILRKGKAFETSVFEGDSLNSTFHYGLFHKTLLIGVVSFMKINNPNYSDAEQYQLRGMAILEEYQGKQLGDLLITHGEKQIKKSGGTLIWLNSREIAVNFYKRNHYKIKGESFEIKDIGTHYLMSKKLD